jgi:hypothetical protein
MGLNLWLFLHVHYEAQLRFTNSKYLLPSVNMDGEAMFERFNLYVFSKGDNLVS